jgi:chromosome segregation ATPase
VKPLSAQDGQQQASPHKAQGVVNVAPGEQAPKQVTYEDFMQQLTQLEKQIKEGGSTATDAELDALTKKVGELESEIGKKARKADLAKKISELTKKLQSEQAEPAEDGEDKNDTNIPKAGEARASGKGIVAVDEINKDALGNFDWFKDMLKAHKRLVGFS